MFKMFWEKYNNLVLTAGIIIVLIFYIDGCSKNNAKDSRIADLLSYKHETKKYLAEDGTTVNYNTNLKVAVEDLIATQDTLLDYITNLKLKIKDVHSSTIITERLRIDTLEVPIYLTDCKFDTTVIIDSTHYDLDIRMKNTGITFNSIEFPNRQGVTISERRKEGKWWKRKETILAVTNSNPYMITDGITSYTLQQNKNFLSKWWVQLTGGVIIGGVSTYLIMK